MAVNISSVEFFMFVLAVSKSCVSFSYLFTGSSYISGQFQSTQRLYDASIGFFVANQKDVSSSKMKIIIIFCFYSFQTT